MQVAGGGASKLYNRKRSKPQQGERFGVRVKHGQPHRVGTSNGLLRIVGWPIISDVLVLTCLLSKKQKKWFIDIVKNGQQALCFIGFLRWAGDTSAAEDASQACFLEWPDADEKK